MDKQVIANKLESLRRCINRVQTKTPASAQALHSDLDLQDILTVNLSRAVQLCVDLSSHIIANSELSVPSTMAEGFDKLVQLKTINEHLANRLKAAVGFRNIATHSYSEINWDITYHICTERLDDFRQFAVMVSLAANLD